MSRKEIFLSGLFLIVLNFFVFSPTLLLSASKSDENAATLVKNWLNKNPAPLGTQLYTDIDRVETSIDEAGAALYHVVYLAPKGVVIVSTDDLIEPIIGFFPEAKNFSQLSDNPLGALLANDMRGRMQIATESSSAVMTKGSKKKILGIKQEKAKSKWNSLLLDVSMQTLKAAKLSNDEIDDIRVSSFIQSRWSQSDSGGGFCYNYYTPNHYPAGCVATATAQVMRYFEYPQTVIGTAEFSIRVDNVEQTVNLRGGNGSGSSYNWENMILSPNSSITEEQRQAIGSLMHDVGASIGMSYASNGSSASTYSAASSLKNTFGYSNSIYGSCSNLSTEQIEKIINTNLDARHPVILSVSRPGGGHAILSDGYGTNNDTPYHHLNMGWGGYSDGWYNLPDIDTGSYHYTSISAVVNNIFSESSGEIISGRVLNTIGDPVEGVLILANSGNNTYSATTDSRGVYAIVHVSSQTSFSVSASKAGHDFSPPQNITTALSENFGNISGNVWGTDFTAHGDITGDINKSGSVDITDSIMALQILITKTGTQPTFINETIDVDGDNAIGLAEAVYALEQAAKD